METFCAAKVHQEGGVQGVVVRRVMAMRRVEGSRHMKATARRAGMAADGWKVGGEVSVVGDWCCESRVARKSRTAEMTASKSLVFLSK